MRLIIARHGETNHNRKDLIQGFGTRLSALGIKQAELLAKRLLKEDISIVYSSDMTRAKQTLKPFLQKKKVKVVFDKDLREMNFGVFKDKSSKHFKNWADKNKKSIFEVKPMKGESFVDVRKRAKRFLDKLLAKEKGNVFIMTHGMTKRALLMNLFKRNDVDYYLKLRELSKNTALTILDIKNNGKHKIIHLYSINHLGELNGN